MARKHLNEILSAFEFLDNDALRASSRHLRLSSPVKSAPFYVLIETSGSHSEHDEQKLQSFVDVATSSELVKDGVIATEPSKIKVFFHISNFAAVGLTELPSHIWTAEWTVCSLMLKTLCRRQLWSPSTEFWSISGEVSFILTVGCGLRRAAARDSVFRVWLVAVSRNALLRTTS